MVMVTTPPRLQPTPCPHHQPLLTLCRGKGKAMKHIFSHPEILETQHSCLCPRKAFFWDLYIELDWWNTAGDNLAVLGDMNGNIQLLEIQQLFKLILHLHKANLSAHLSSMNLTTFMCCNQPGQSSK